MNIIKAFWYYLGEQQTKFLRLLHITIALLVVSQLLSSNGIGFTPDDQIASPWYNQLFTRMHITIGILLCLLSSILIIYCFATRGIRYFFPYLFGDFQQIKQDISSLLSRKLPDATPGGLASCVQGLGLGAITLVLLSGLGWFLLWRDGATLAPEIRTLHKTLTGLIVIYIIGHSMMGILHFIFQLRKKSSEKWTTNNQ